MTKKTHHIYGESPALQEVLRTSNLVAITDVTALITGEAGTGKELLARVIHQKSKRGNKTFLSVDCSSLNTSEIDALLFEHQTNVDELNAVQGGTLFLDEVAELPLPSQSQLLNFLENTSVNNDVRIIAASKHNLEDLVLSGDFRDDLFYRLNIVPLDLPPLRKRCSDLNILIDAFFRDLVASYKMPPPNLSKATVNKLSHYPWPGNIRELHSFCERIFILMSGQTVDVSNLPANIVDYRPKDSNTFVLPASGIDINKLECNLIEQALSNTQGNKSHAARLLGLSRDKFLYRLKKYTISD
ncbi:MAG: Sigma-54-dependent Fis family transcriptional regulator [uncultured Thiotrichaceae bacterium]|uniref:Sigma-54-dependent Fis family transcriptional regulator n=1 Tax=uncultured Thiotrichaceae bacterium TaxID=298394 RepID=A0A6S6UEL9_9GAMM|nr:MAG: Sigma-54-dependent Fis family transcriptional regulator [uncultured Thiotrichaceae bacterium]